ALELNRRNDSKPKSLRDRIARNLVNIGLAQEHLGDLDAALAAYKEALALQREMGGGVNAVQTLLNLCALHWRQGNYDAALQCHEEARAEMDKAAGADWVP